MDVHIQARHCNLTQQEHDAAVQAAEHLMKYHDNILRVDIIATEEAGRKEAEFSVRIQGQTIIGREHAADHGKAIHDARLKVGRQLVKINERKRTIRNTPVAP